MHGAGSPWNMLFWRYEKCLIMLEIVIALLITHNKSVSDWIVCFLGKESQWELLPFAKTYIKIQTKVVIFPWICHPSVACCHKIYFGCL